MRLAVLAFGLLLAVPAAAADRTEQIRLQYLQVSEVESLLTPPAERGPEFALRQTTNNGQVVVPSLPSIPGRGMLIAGTHLVPDGITAWTADPRKNVLVVSGEPAAIERLRTIIKLVDVAPTQVRLSVRLLKLDAAALQELGVEQLAFDGADGSLGHLVVAVLDKGRADGIAKLPTTSSVEMVTDNNRALYVRWPRADQPDATLASIVPRINGDKSVTLMLPGRVHQVLDGQVASTHFMALRRLAPGQSLLVQPHGEGLTAIITIKEVVTRVPVKKSR